MTSIEPGPQGRWVGNTLAEFERDLADNLCYERGTTAESASAQDAYWTLAITIRDRLADRRARTARANYTANPKFVYYLSAEYMLGRQLRQNALYTGTAELARRAMAGSGFSAGELDDLDVEPGLGNGGLGRLAACLLDSLATLDLPAVGYGIRYEFGIFKQTFEDGHQVELPDDWTFYGNPWEFPAPDDLQVVGFYGHTEAVDDDQGGLRACWVPGQVVRGEPSHMLVPGYGTQTVNILRLWRARAGGESFDLGLFNAGRYAEAVEAQMRSENLTKVLYPSDSTEAGRELRLKQQYFLVSCSLRDIIRRFRFRNSDWEAFPDKVVIQLNDTHPVLAIPELMRLLVDENGVGWEQAWSITRRTFAYTCHTLLPEALETWPVPMFGRLLPRHLEIIHALNRFFLEDVRARYPGDDERAARMSLIQEGPEHRVRMANLAVVGSFAVNGVAELQSRLLAQTTLRDFADLWPDRFLNVTNGVSPRRFLRLANPRLSALITARLGDDRWLTDLERLRKLEAFADDAEFRAQWREAKRQNKIDLAFHVLAATGVIIDPASLFDVMVKRLHEYKRQFLKLLHVITVYNRIKADPAAAVTPCTVIFGAKAAPSYQQAKRIIKLINSVAAVVNADPDVAGRIKVVFIPDYNVSVAELVVAAGNLSEQISLAGGHHELGDRDVVVGNEHDLDPAGHVGVGIDHGRDRVDQLDDALGLLVARRGLGAEDDRAGRHGGGRVCLDPVVHGDDVEQLEELALVLVQPLDHDVEQRSGIDDDAGGGEDMKGQVDLVLPLGLAPLRPELRIIGEGLELPQPFQVGQPPVVSQPGRDQGGQARVGQPEEPARADAVRDI